MPLGDSIDPELGYDPELLTKAIARALPPTYDFEIPQTISKLRKRKCTHVALQLPDGLLQFATVLSDIFKKFCTPYLRTVTIVADAVFGACCIDDLTCRAIGADAMVHYGHSCLTPVDQTVVYTIYVLVRISYDVNHMTASLAAAVPPEQRPVALMATVQFSQMLDEAKDIMRRKYGWEADDLFVPQIKPLSKGETLGCTAPSLDDRAKTIYYVADGRFHLEGAMLASPTIKNVLRYCPYTRRLFREGLDQESMHRTREEEIERARASKKTVGLILGTLGRQGSVGILESVREIIHNSGRETVTVLLSEITTEKLRDLGDSVGCWVEVACPRLALDWGAADYSKDAPMLSSYEACVAFGKEKYGRPSSNGCSSSSCCSSKTDKEPLRYPMDYYSNTGGVWSNYRAKGGFGGSQSGQYTFWHMGPGKAAEAARPVGAAAAIHALEVQLAGVTEERDALVRRLKKHKFWSSSSSMWILQLQEKQEEITSLQVKMANMEAKLAEVSRDSQAAAVITPPLSALTMTDGECQTDSTDSSGSFGDQQPEEDGSPSYFPSINAALASASKADLEKQVRELQRQVEVMRPKVSQYYVLSSELARLKEENRDGLNGIDIAVDTSGLQGRDSVSTQTDSSVASRGGSQTVAAWQQVGQLRDKLRDTEIALKRSQRQLSDLQEQHARAGAELRASWAKREAETHATAAVGLCPSCSRSTSGSEKGDSPSANKEAEGRLEELQLALKTSQQRADSFASELFKAQDELSTANGQLIQQRRKMAELGSKVDSLKAKLSEQYELAAQRRESEESLAASRQEVIDELSDQIRAWVSSHRDLSQKYQALEHQAELSRLDATDRASELSLAQATADKAMSNARALKIEYAEVTSQLAIARRQLDELKASHVGIRPDDTLCSIQSSGSSSSGPSQGPSFGGSSSSDGYPIVQVADAASSRSAALVQHLIRRGSYQRRR
ncbi:Diphthamide biosynthesis protein 1 [Perkinsus olseni]|uniref:2-(3-amino-3-carboxypropyl)histidine synthase subunit 1 n=1 Tax=Perkinsus olseni TaxID=32597 RepID=A0A7J6MNY0_PEROL|nr:Diphthamide biosynthesis protein 1 [Perkinsus olseni]